MLIVKPAKATVNLVFGQLQRRIQNQALSHQLAD